jgi:methylated-DNA-[protein]-cysteine S-methyltransferase
MDDPIPALCFTLIPSPLGLIGIAASPRGICRVSLCVRDASAFRKVLRKEYHCRPVRRDRRFHKIANRVRAYFAGKPVRFDTALDLRAGTTFQKRVWDFLRSIPHGQTRSYRDVARGIGRPHSFRAVGGACGSNPVGIIIPCHRVINTGGKMGGFSGGLRSKRYLLRLEGSRPSRRME